MTSQVLQLWNVPIYKYYVALRRYLACKCYYLGVMDNLSRSRNIEFKEPSQYFFPCRSARTVMLRQLDSSKSALIRFATAANRSRKSFVAIAADRNAVSAEIQPNVCWPSQIGQHLGPYVWGVASTDWRGERPRISLC